MKKLVNLSDLMLEQLRDLYDGEVQIHQALIHANKYASHPRLTDLMKRYVDANEEQQMRIRQVFEMLFTQKRGEKSEPIAALVDQFESLVKRCEDLEILDALIIVNLQHIIHYKIASYGAICTYLKHLGLLEAAEIMHKSLDVEKESDREFSKIADSFIDREAIAPMS
jgi:ferritin-like metal-binding protein YciE